jgi:NAD(P)H-dependent FMN reductase
VIEGLEARDDVQAELVDLRDYPLPWFELPVSPVRIGREYTDPAIERWGNKLDEADGFVMIVPEYNHGYPAVLKNHLDHVFVEVNRKPVAYVGYGNVGGARAIEQLRLVCVELDMAPMRHAVHVLPDVMIAARQAEDYDASLFAALEPRRDLLLDNLMWWAGALAAARAPVG